MSDRVHLDPSSLTLAEIICAQFPGETRTTLARLFRVAATYPAHELIAAACALEDRHPNSIRICTGCDQIATTDCCDIQHPLIFLTCPDCGHMCFV